MVVQIFAEYRPHLTSAVDLILVLRRHLVLHRSLAVETSPTSLLVLVVRSREHHHLLVQLQIDLVQRDGLRWWLDILSSCSTESRCY